MIADITDRRRRLRVTGEDRVAFLHGQGTNDIRSLRSGLSCYAAFLNAKGKMRGEGHVICLSDAFLLEVNEDLPASLEKFIITEDVAIEDVSATLRAWLVIGSLPALPSAAITFAHPLGTGVISPVLLPVTLDAPTLDAMRIEAGLPAWGVDMDENTIPIEAGLEARAINYEKGCYIGQETIARIKTYGHVNRQLVQLALGKPLSPRDSRGEGLGEGSLPGNGERILTGDKPVGHVTSAARSNRLGKALALGYVRREFAVVGNKLIIGQQPAEVLKICGQ